MKFLAKVLALTIGVAIFLAAIWLVLFLAEAITHLLEVLITPQTTVILSSAFIQ